MLSERSVLPSIDESPVNGYGTLERVLRDTPQNSTLERNFKMSPLTEGPVETSPNRDSVYSDSVISTEDRDMMEPDLDQDNLGDDVSMNELVSLLCVCVCVCVCVCAYVHTTYVHTMKAHTWQISSWNLLLFTIVCCCLGSS